MRTRPMRFRDSYCVVWRPWAPLMCSCCSCAQRSRGKALLPCRRSGPNSCCTWSFSKGIPRDPAEVRRNIQLVWIYAQMYDTYLRYTMVYTNMEWFKNLCIVCVWCMIAKWQDVWICMDLLDASAPASSGSVCGLGQVVPELMWISERSLIHCWSPKLNLNISSGPRTRSSYSRHGGNAFWASNGCS